MSIFVPLTNQFNINSIESQNQVPVAEDNMEDGTKRRSSSRPGAKRGSYNKKKQK